MFLFALLNSSFTIIIKSLFTLIFYWSFQKIHSWKALFLKLFIILPGFSNTNFIGTIIKYKMKLTRNWLKKVNQYPKPRSKKFHSQFLTVLQHCRLYTLNCLPIQIGQLKQTFKQYNQIVLKQLINITKNQKPWFLHYYDHCTGLDSY